MSGYDELTPAAYEVLRENEKLRAEIDRLRAENVRLTKHAKAMDEIAAQRDELLAALKAAETGGAPWPKPLRDTIRAAIAKAEGE